MTKYNNLDRVGKIVYAKENLPRETIIAYQNELAKSMSPLFETKKTMLVPEFTQISGTFETDIEQITPTDAHTNNVNNNSPCGED